MNTASFPRYIVRPDDTIESALTVIEGNRHRSVIVVNDDGIVVGTLTDGDVRKAILDRRLLTTPVHRVMNTNFLAVARDEPERARAVFEEQRYIVLIPVVDDEGRLVDVLTAY